MANHCQWMDDKQFVNKDRRFFEHAADSKKTPLTGNVIEIRKFGHRRNAVSKFFVTIFRILLDKYGEMCGLFANPS